MKLHPCLAKIVAGDIIWFINNGKTYKVKVSCLIDVYCLSYGQIKVPAFLIDGAYSSFNPRLEKIIKIIKHK